MLDNYKSNNKQFRKNMGILITGFLLLFVWGIIIAMQLDYLPIQYYKLFASVGTGLFLIVMIIIRKVLIRLDYTNIVVTIIIDYLLVFIYSLMFGALFWAHDNVDSGRIDYNMINAFIILYMSTVTFASLGYLIGMQPLANLIRNAVSKPKKIGLMLANSYLGIGLAIIPLGIAIDYGITMPTVIFVVIISLTVVASLLMLNQLTLKRFNSGIELEAGEVNRIAIDMIMIAMLSPFYIFYYLINYQRLHK